MKNHILFSVLALFLTLQSIAQKLPTPQQQLAKQKKEYLQKHHILLPQSRIDSLPDYIKQIGQYKPQRATNPSHKLDSAIFSYAFADTVLNTLGRIIYSFNQSQQLTEFVVSKFDSSYTQSWEDSYKRSYTYNSTGKLTQWRQYSWYSYYNKWEPTDGEDFIFNTNDSIVQHIYYKWNNTLNYLIQDYKQDYFYDSTNHCYLEKGYSWNYTHQKWNLLGRTLRYYDSLYQQVKIEIYSWYSSTNTWQAYEQLRYQYDSSGLLSQKIVATGFNSNNTWKDRYRMDYVYNSASQIDTIFHYDNDSLITNWQFLYITVNSYNSAGNITKSISQVNDSLGNYQDISRYFYEYNASNYLTLFWSEYISSKTNKWTGWWKYRLYYDANNNITSHWGYDYDSTNHAWDSVLVYASDFESSLSNQDIIIPRNDYLFQGLMHFDELYPLMRQSNNALKHYSTYREDYLSGVYYQNYYYTFYYSAIDASISNLDSRKLIRIFPNPTSKFLNIEIENQNNDEGTIEIYDIQGRKFYNFKSSSNKRIQIDVSQLKAGLYFIKYNSNQQSAINKFIIE
jgi:hypothetical protein